MNPQSLVRVYKSSYKCLLSKPIVTRHGCNCKFIQQYSQHKGEENEEIGSLNSKERAPSTAEVMQELSREKEEKETSLDEKDRQGFVSHTSEKAMDAAKEVVGGGDVDHEAIKEKYKDTSHGETYHKPRNNGASPTSI